MAVKSKICLVGFMGSGKSTIGRLLAEELSLEFIDLDEYLESKSGKSIGQIFEESGEEYFRELESDCLREILEFRDEAVIALGGGTPCQMVNAGLIQTHVTLYLNTSVTRLYRRLRNEKSNRPLIKNLTTTQLKEYIQRTLDERHSHYMNSKICIRNTGTPAEVVKRILKALNSPSCR